MGIQNNINLSLHFKGLVLFQKRKIRNKAPRFSENERDQEVDCFLLPNLTKLEAPNLMLEKQGREAGMVAQAVGCLPCIS